MRWLLSTTSDACSQVECCRSTDYPFRRAGAPGRPPASTRSDAAPRGRQRGCGGQLHLVVPVSAARRINPHWPACRARWTALLELQSADELAETNRLFDGEGFEDGEDPGARSWLTATILPDKVGSLFGILYRIVGCCCKGGFHDGPHIGSHHRTPEAGNAPVLAPRPADLKGQVLGIVANGLGISEVMFDGLAAALCEERGVRDVVKVVKPSVAVPPWPEQWEEITTQATVAVTGFGGCGSCSTRSMQMPSIWRQGDPLRVRRAHALVPAVRALARLVGAPDYPIVVVDYPHNPTAMWDKDEAAAIGSQVVEDVYRCLTAGH